MFQHFYSFLFTSSSAEQIDLLENVFALSKGANYKNDKTFVSTANNTYTTRPIYNPIRY